MKAGEAEVDVKPIKLSIIIPVYNEEKRINSLLSHLVAITLPLESEILISDGHKDLTTINSIDKHYLLLNNIITVTAPLNRGNQMNKAAEIAKGETLLFLHADTFISQTALESIPQSLGGKTSAGAFKLGIDSKKLRYRLIEKLINSRTRLTKTPYGDQAFFIRKDYFFHMNGFFKFPIMEDIDLMRRIKKDKGNIIIADYQVITSGRRWEKEGFFRCTLRNWFILIMYYIGVHPNKLIKYYKY